MGDKWNGQITNFKISENSFPELYQELSHLHHRERSDRLRILAIIGLMKLKESSPVERRVIDSIEESNELLNVDSRSDLDDKKEDELLDDLQEMRDCINKKLIF